MRLFNLLKSLARPRRLHNWYNPSTGGDNRPTTINVPSDNYGGIRKYLATSAMPDRPNGQDGHVIQLDWDNSDNWATQIIFPNADGNPKFREQLHYPDWSGSTGWYTILSDKNVADYVIETGTQGVWTWCKWNGGKAECWFTDYDLGSCAMTSSYGNAYYVSKSGYTFPTGLFAVTPSVFLSTAAGSGLLSVSLYSTNSTGYSFYLFDSRSETISHVYLSGHAIGRWK